MNNEDIENTRFYYQHHVVDKLSQAKFNLNLENRISIFNMSSETFLIHNAKSISSVLRSIHQLSASKHINILHALKTGLLALKHRPETNQRMRIILCIGSSTRLSQEEQEQIMLISKQIKRQKIGLDIINIGIESTLIGFYENFINACNGPDELWYF